MKVTHYSDIFIQILFWSIINLGSSFSSEAPTTYVKSQYSYNPSLCLHVMLGSLQFP